MYNDESKSYSEFKLDFYKRFPQTSVFKLNANINLLKVVLSGLRVNYVNRGKVRNFFFYSRVKLFLFKLFKNKRTQKPEFKNNECKVVIFGSDRYVKIDSGKEIEKYSGNIQKVEGRENCLVVSNDLSSSHCDYDITFNVLKSGITHLKLSRSEKGLLTQLKNKHKDLVLLKTLRTTELDNVEVAFHQFFMDYIIAKRILEASPKIEKMYLVCHYHNEGKILAAREMGVNIIELQHGLISKHDIFYCFPEIVCEDQASMLFPDKIWVWGEYWKKMLSNGFEYSSEKIEVKGDFVVYPESKISLELTEFLNTDATKIIMCTQVSLHEYFIHFIKEIVKNNPSIRLVVKHHPSESIEIYQKELTGIDNVYVCNDNIYAIFSKVQIHVSIYSTTLLESLKFGLSNYSMDVEICKDYTSEFVKEGISKLIDDSWIVDPNKKSEVDPKEFFEVFEPSAIYLQP